MAVDQPLSLSVIGTLARQVPYRRIFAWANRLLSGIERAQITRIWMTWIFVGGRVYK